MSSSRSSTKPVCAPGGPRQPPFLDHDFNCEPAPPAACALAAGAAGARYPQASPRSGSVRGEPRSGAKGQARRRVRAASRRRGKKVGGISF